MRFYWSYQTFGTTDWIYVGAATSTTAAGPDGSTHTLPAVAVSPGRTYRMKAVTESQLSGYETLYSDYSGLCHFVVDATPPDAPTITALSTYVLCNPGCASGGGAGQKGTFGVTAKAVDPNITTVQYRLRNDDTGVWEVPLTTKAAAPTGPTTLDVTPAASGRYTLEASVIDRWNRASTFTSVKFQVG